MSDHADNPGTPVFSFGQVRNSGKNHTAKQLFRLTDLGARADVAYKLSVQLAGQPQGLTARLSTREVILPQACSGLFDLELKAEGAKLPEGGYYGWIVAEAKGRRLQLPFYYEAVRRAAENPTVPSRPAPQQEKRPERHCGLDCY